MVIPFFILKVKDEQIEITLVRLRSFAFIRSSLKTSTCVNFHLSNNDTATTTLHFSENLQHLSLLLKFLATPLITSLVERKFK